MLILCVAYGEAFWWCQNTRNHGHRRWLQRMNAESAKAIFSIHTLPRVAKQPSWNSAVSQFSTSLWSISDNSNHLAIENFFFSFVAFLFFSTFLFTFFFSGTELAKEFPVTIFIRFIFSFISLYFFAAIYDFDHWINRPLRYTQPHGLCMCMNKTALVMVRLQVTLGAKRIRRS